MDHPPLPKHMWLYVVSGVLAVVALIIYVLQMAGGFDAGMSGHGWAALIIGVTVSILLGGGLTAALIWGRRNGYDENVYEMYSDRPDDSETPDT